MPGMPSPVPGVHPAHHEKRQVPNLIQGPASEQNQRAKEWAALRRQPPERIKRREGVSGRGLREHSQPGTWARLGPLVAWATLSEPQPFTCKMKDQSLVLRSFPSMTPSDPAGWATPHGCVLWKQLDSGVPVLLGLTVQWGDRKLDIV